jgi:hypothetical protein
VQSAARDWAKEYAELSSRSGDLPPEDLERFAIAAHLLGEDEQVVRLLDRAHSEYLDRGAPDKAARAVYWLIFQLLNAGQAARAAGWLARLHRILHDHDPDGRQSYLPLLLEGASRMQAGAVNEALPMLERAATGQGPRETTTHSC